MDGDDLHVFVGPPCLLAFEIERFQFCFVHDHRDEFQSAGSQARHPRSRQSYAHIDDYRVELAGTSADLTLQISETSSSQKEVAADDFADLLAALMPIDQHFHIQRKNQCT